MSRVLKVRCPACKNMSDWSNNEFRPFCSEKCKSRDLGKWAMEAYRVPGEPAEAVSSEELEAELERKKGS